jgi:hypothetical protein
MAGRKSVKRGGKKRSMQKRSMRKSRKGLRKRSMIKRSGKKTYKRSIKKGGDEYDDEANGPSKFDHRLKQWTDLETRGASQRGEYDVLDEPPEPFAPASKRISLNDEEKEEMLSKLYVIQAGNRNNKLKPHLSEAAKHYIVKLEDDTYKNFEIVTIKDFINVHLHNEDQSAFARRKRETNKYAITNTK